MHQSIDNLLEQAKKLSTEDRALLINAQYDLNAPHDLEWEAAWLKECEDRIAAINRGEMKTYDFDAVMVEARARLKHA